MLHKYQRVSLEIWAQTYVDLNLRLLFDCKHGWNFCSAVIQVLQVDTRTDRHGEVNGHIFFSAFRCDRAKETQFILAGQKTSTTICKGRGDIHDEHLYFRPLKPSGYHIYHLLQHTKTQHPANSLFVCFVSFSQ